MGKNENAISKKMRDALLTDPFGLEETLDLTHNYLRIPQQNPPYTHKNYFLGLFSGDFFKALEENTGVRFWYCLNKSRGPYPKFFLAMEALKNYDKNNPEAIPDENATLFLPKMIGYWNGSNDKPRIKQYLERDLFRNTVPGPNKIKMNKVREFAENFKAYISNLSNHSNGLADPSIKYAVAFFENNEPFKDFMRRNPDRVAFIMGYQKVDILKPNYLRPILAGIDKDGKLILPRGTGQDILNGKTMLQHSWPPPPDD